MQPGVKAGGAATPGLRPLRRRLGWSQRDLAEQAGITVSTVCRLENGHLAQWKTLAKLGQCLKVNVADLTRIPSPPKN